jgi:phage shock protein PspC (stress-responsive transcriptional regulator)
MKDAPYSGPPRSALRSCGGHWAMVDLAATLFIGQARTARFRPKEDLANQWNQLIRTSGHDMDFAEKLGRWEFWFALALSGLCGGIGSYFGSAQGHPQLGAVLGGASGGFILSRMHSYLSRR